MSAKPEALTPTQSLILTVMDHGTELDVDIIHRQPLDLEAVSHAISFLAAVLIQEIGFEKTRDIVEDLVVKHAPQIQVEPYAKN